MTGFGSACKFGSAEKVVGHVSSLRDSRGRLSGRPEVPIKPDRDSETVGWGGRSEDFIRHKGNTNE